MFISKEEVKNMTGYDVTSSLLTQAQAIIESYTGKPEVAVTNPIDLSILAKATGFQAAYLSENSETVYEQVGSVNIQQFGQMMTFDTANGAPFIAPLAAIACRNLSWFGSRSISTGKTFQDARPVRWERD